MKTLIWILIIYLVYKLFKNLISPASQSAFFTVKNEKKEGETVISKVNHTPSSKRSTEGEYIDYQEVK